jgi:hypothetical protein
MTAFLIAVSYVASASAADAAPAADSRLSLPGFGMTFSAPQGWVRAPESNYSQLARFARVADGNVAGLLEVAVAPAKGASAAEFAATMAKEMHGEVVTPSAGGGSPAAGASSPAVEVNLAATQRFPAMVAAVMTVRDQVVVFSVGEAGDDAARSVLRSAASSVAWSAPKPASDDLALRRRPIALFGSPLLILLPEPFRPSRVDQPATQAFFGARDWPSGRDEASVEVQAVANNGATVADVARAAAAELPLKLGLKEQVAFEKANDTPPVYVSTAFSPAPGEAQRIVYAALDDKRLAVLVFRTTAPDAAVRERYMTMAVEVATSMRASSDQQAGGSSAPHPGK